MRETWKIRTLGRHDGGKLADSQDSFNFSYVEVDPGKENFSISVSFEVEDASGSDYQSGYGIMVVDTVASSSSLSRHRNSLMVGCFRSSIRYGYSYGVRIVGGYTDREAMPQDGRRLLDASRLFPSAIIKDRINDGERQVFSLEKTNEGFVASMRTDSGEETIFVPGCDFLLRQDRRAIYVGIAVAGNIKMNISDTSINTAPYGSITLFSNVSGKVESHTDFYLDGIAPTLLAVAVLERLDTARSDRVYMQFSEPISSPGTEWPVQLFATDGNTLLDAPTVKFTQLYNESLNVWEFEIAYAADGSSVVTEGMFAQLLSTSGIRDKSGNGVSACGQPKLPITLKLLPVPMVYASISDADENGIAERIYVEFERPIDPKHYPDSISVVFGRTDPETTWVSGSVPVYAADGMTAVLDLPTPFSYGVTSGTYEGASKGMNISGAGLVTQHLGSGASYESNSALGEDKVGPVIVSATIDMSKSDRFDMLNMSISEPYTIVDSSLV